MKVLISESALKQYKKINKPYSELIKNKIDTLGQNGLNNNEVKALTGEFKKKILQILCYPSSLIIQLI